MDGGGIESAGTPKLHAFCPGSGDACCLSLSQVFPFHLGNTEEQAGCHPSEGTREVKLLGDGDDADAGNLPLAYSVDRPVSLSADGSPAAPPGTLALRQENVPQKVRQNINSCCEHKLTPKMPQDRRRV